MDELPKAFEPKLVEDKWYTFWESEGCFIADSSSKKPAYSLVMPPPNVTGVLHMGHALVNTLQDVLVRWKRMSGFEVCWIPGTDHAGIATQTVVEKQLIAKTGKRRKDFPREEFLSHVLDFKEKSQHSILHQLRKLGCSCDWSRLAFTLDEPRSLAVNHVFKKLFTEGLIYRGDYLVNWDPMTQTALADDEVEHEERNSFLWHFRYPLVDGSGYIVIATTRPETLLGDTAVAVSSGDLRYNHLIGKELLLPIMNRKIPIITDRHVDPAFGSGAVKVTPAHDPNDYEMGLTHNLPFINIMTPDGKINSNGQEFEGMTMEEARQAVVAKMQALGLVEKIVPHTNRVGISYRSKAVIEPFLSKQWFVKMSSFKQTLRSLVEEKKVKLIPESWENTYFHWIDNLRDWCISRQLWWGHRIPIWYNKKNLEEMICYAEEGLPPEVAKNPEEWTQEEDVLDTWFSSALWPFSTLGWPAKTEDFAKFYPNSVLVTGHDILFFWVARMILMGSYVCEAPPFPETFLHGLIYGKSYWTQKKDGPVEYITGEERLSYDLGKPLPKDVQSKWEKMSKSKGNIIDPLEIIDAFGTDAIRMALCASATQARQIDLDRRKFEEFKNFANKMWNGARFVFMNLSDLSAESFATGLNESLFTLEDRWILSLLGRTVEKVTTFLSEYHFDKAASAAYDFFWKEFCAYYVEMSKPFLTHKTGTLEVRENKQKLLTVLLCTSLRLLHPMAPFITEELFNQLKKKFPILAQANSDVYTTECLAALSSKTCMQSVYPTVLKPEDKQLSIEETFVFLDEVLHAIRNIRAEMQLPPGMATDVWILGEAQDPLIETIKQNQSILGSLVKIRSLHFPNQEEEPAFSAKKRIHSLQILIPLPEEMKEKEKLRLIKEKEKLQIQFNSLEEKLSQQEFLTKAPKEILDKLQTQRDLVRAQLADIETKISS
ncbi:MAG: valine--tRNA ligase [Chlamydiota bacterium]